MLFRCNLGHDRRAAPDLRRARHRAALREDVGWRALQLGLDAGHLRQGKTGAHAASPGLVQQEGKKIDPEGLEGENWEKTKWKKPEIEIAEHFAN